MIDIRGATLPLVLVLSAVAIMPCYASPKVTFGSPPDGIGLELIEGASPEFLLAIRGVADTASIEALSPIFPYSVIIKNNGTSRFVAIVIRYQRKDQLGVTRYDDFMIRTPAKQNRNMILPGQMVLMTPMPSLNRVFPAGISPSQNGISSTSGLKHAIAVRLNDYESQSEIVITLDSATLETGEVFGADETHNIERMNNWRRAEQSLYVELLQARTLEQCRTHLLAVSNAPETPAPTLASIDQYAFHRRRTADLFLLRLDGASPPLDLRSFLDWVGPHVNSQIPFLFRTTK